MAYEWAETWRQQWVLSDASRSCERQARAAVWSEALLIIDGNQKLQRNCMPRFDTVSSRQAATESTRCRRSSCVVRQAVDSVDHHVDVLPLLYVTSSARLLNAQRAKSRFVHTADALPYVVLCCNALRCRAAPHSTVSGVNEPLHSHYFIIAITARKLFQTR